MWVQKEWWLDFRDPETVWVWIDDYNYLEFSKDEIEDILKGFDQ